MALGEFELIARWFSPTPRRRDVSLGVGDDAALLEVPPNRLLVAATDTLVEGRHFLPDAPARSVGHQALAVNLSDLAAMGAEPAWALLSLSLPSVDETWLDGFASGFRDLAARYDVDLVGGDTVRGPLVVTVQVLGFVERARALTRGGARPGNRIYVSGTPGEAAAGLEALRLGSTDGRPERLVQRCRYAEPRIELGRALGGRASAAMDVSDGLAGDLAKLCAASGVGARIDLDALPVSDALAAVHDRAAAERYVLCGGDDYELVFTLPAATADEVIAGLPAGVRVSRIGEIVPGEGVTWLRGGRAVPGSAAGYDHFS
ncbi:MAG: thiamine-phosphate kinase [Steroidobacteraceae bacterium]